MRNLQKRAIAFLITMIMVINIAPVSAPAEKNTGGIVRLALPVVRDGIKYNIEDDHATVLGLADDATGTAFTIQAAISYNGATYPVTTIGENAFKGSSGLTITIQGDHVEVSGEWGDDDDYNGNTGAFAYSSYNTIIFTGKRITVGKGAFCYNTGTTVQSVYAQTGGTFEIKQKAFAFCNNLNLRVGSGQTVSGSEFNMFQSTSGTLAFLGGVSNLGSYSFFGSSISQITTTTKDTYNWNDAGLNYTVDFILKANQDEQVYWPRWNIVNSMTIDFDEEVSILNQNTFRDLGNGTAPITVNLNSGVGTIKANAFSTLNAGAGSLINIYGNSTTVEEDAFPDSANLTVNFDMYKSSVTGADLLDDLEMTTVNYKLETATYHDDMFEYILYKGSSNSVLYAEVTGIYDGFTGSSIIFTNTTRDDNHYPVRGIQSAALKNNPTVTQIIFDNESTFSVEANAFESMSALTSVVLKGNGQVEVGNKAFYNCTALETVSGEGGAATGNATFDGGQAFLGCSALKTVRLGQIGQIGLNTFAGLNALETVEINSAEIIAAGGFNQCQGLKSFRAYGNISVLAKYAFYKCNALETVRIDGNISTIESYSITYCESLNTVRIGGDVGTIERWAFYYGCEALEQFIILGHIDFMSKGAVNSPSIRVAVFKNGIGTIETWAFYHDDSFTQENNLIYVSSVNSVKDYSFGYVRYEEHLYFNITQSQLRTALGSDPDDTWERCHYADQNIGADVYVKEGASTNGDGTAANKPRSSYRSAMNENMFYNTWNRYIRFQEACDAAGAGDLGLVYYDKLKPDFDGYILHVLPSPNTNAANFPKDWYGEILEDRSDLNLPKVYHYLKTVTFEDGVETVNIPEGAFNRFPKLETVEVKNPDAVVTIGKDAFKGTLVDSICTAQQTVASDAGTVTLTKGTDAPIGTALVIRSDSGNHDGEIIAAARNAGLFAGIQDEDIRIKYFDLSLVSPAGEVVNKPAHVNITQKLGVFSGLESVAPQSFAFFHISNGNVEMVTSEFSTNMAANTISFEFDADGFSPYAAAYVVDVRYVSDGIYIYAVDDQNNATIVDYGPDFTGNVLGIPSQTTISGEVYQVIGIGDSALSSTPTGITITSVSFNNNNRITVSSNAFGGLTTVERIEFNGTGTVEFTDTTAFTGCGTGTVTVSMPNGIAVKSPDDSCGTVFKGIEGGYALILDNITYIPANAFKNDTKLKTVTIKSALENQAEFDPTWPHTSRTDFANNAIGTSAFEGATSLSSFTVEGSAGESIAIGNEAFKDCVNLTSLSISDKICGIGEHGLSNTGFTSLTLQVEDLALGQEAIAYCSNLRTVEFVGEISCAGDDYLGGSGASATMVEQLVFNGYVSMQMWERSIRSERLKVLVFKNGGVDSILDGAFYTQGSILEQNLTVYVDGKDSNDPSIYDGAFPAKKKVRIYMNLPQTREESDRSYWIKNARNVEDLAFSMDEAPTDLYVDASVSEDAIQTGTVGAPFNSLNKAMEAADKDYDHATRFRRYFTDAGYDPSDLYFTEGNHAVTEFALHIVGETPTIDNTFAGERRLTGLEIQTNCDTEITANAFTNCTNLKTFEIYKANGNLTIGESAFSGCVKLDDLSIVYVKDLLIKKNSFENCAALTALKAPYYSVYAQKDLDNLTIESNAFKNTGITEISVFQADQVKIGTNAFAGAPVNSIAVKASGDIVMAENAFIGVSTLESITLENSGNYTDTLINANAFANCGVIESVLLLGNKAPSVKADAFKNTSIELLRADAGSSGIEAGAFDNSKTLGTYIDGSMTFNNTLSSRIGHFRNVILTNAQRISADAQVFGENPSLMCVYLGKDTTRENAGGEIFAGMPETAVAYVALKKTDFTEEKRPVRSDGEIHFLDDGTFKYIDGTNTNEDPDGSEENGFRTFAQAKEYAASLGPVSAGESDEYYYTDTAEMLRDAFNKSGIAFSEHDIRFPVPVSGTNAITFLVKGTVNVNQDETWDSGNGRTIILLRNEEFTDQPIVNVTGGTLTLGKVVLDGNALKSSKPIIESNNTNTTIIIHNGAWLRNNDNAACGAWDGLEYVGGGAIRTKGNIIMDGGTISGNKACYGSGVHISCGTFTMTGGSIESNTAYLAAKVSNVNYSCGGGVLLTRNAVMNMSGGSVSGNYADYGSGAGISVGSLYGVNDSNRATFHMTGGEISKNTSRFEGGGLYIQMGSKAYITKGRITENSSQGGVASPNYGGGGIYVNGSHDVYKFPDGELHLSKVLITGNSASTAGGGIAGCGTSTSKIYLTDGSAIYANKAGDNADLNFDYVSYAAYYGYSYANMEATVSPYMFNRTPYNWIDAETNQPVPEADLALIKRTVHLRANPGNGAPTTGDVIISGNTAASRGGGIGSNGKIFIGNEPAPQTITMTPQAGKIVINHDMEEGQRYTFSTYLEQYIDSTKLVYSGDPVYYHIFDREKLLSSNAYVANAKDKQQAAITNLPTCSVNVKASDLGDVITLLVVEDTRSDEKVIADENTYLEFQYVVGLGADGGLTAYLKKVSKGTYQRKADGIPDFSVDVKEYVYRNKTYYHRNTSPVEPEDAVFNNIMTYQELSADKTWIRADGSTTTPPKGAKVVFELYADGKATGRRIELDGVPDPNGEFEAWTATWKDIDIYRKDQDGKPYKAKDTDEDYVKIQYSVKEVAYSPANFRPVHEQESISNGKASIANKETPTKAPESIRVSKQWDDMENLDGSRPDSITMTLLADGKEKQTVVLNEGNGWTAEVTGLPVTNAQGKTIAYTWKEEDAAGYTGKAEIAGNETVFTNTHKPELTSVSVRKIWDDNDNEEKIRPIQIVMKLSNGMVAVLNAKNNWTATISDLPVTYKGQKIEYTWTEVEVIGYDKPKIEQNGNITVFTNTIWKRPDEPEHGKKPKVPGKPTEIFEEYDTPLGVEVMINHVGDCFD